MRITNHHNILNWINLFCNNDVHSFAGLRMINTRLNEATCCEIHETISVFAPCRTCAWACRQCGSRRIQTAQSTMILLPWVSRFDASVRCWSSCANIFEIFSPKCRIMNWYPSIRRAGGALSAQKAPTLSSKSQVASALCWRLLVELYAGSSWVGCWCQFVKCEKLDSLRWWRNWFLKWKITFNFAWYSESVELFVREIVVSNRKVKQNYTCHETNDISKLGASNYV